MLKIGMFFREIFNEKMSDFSDLRISPLFIDF